MNALDLISVARALRSQGNSVLIVVMTAAESANLAKPFGLDELLATVQRFRTRGRTN